MKKLSKLSITLLSSLLLVGCGESTPIDPKEPTLLNITLSGEYQTSFEVGDEFNCEGLIINAYFSDSSLKEVEPTSVSTPDMSSSGEKEVVVTYLDKSINYTITVNEPSVYEGYMYLSFYQIDILKSDNSKHYLNPGIKDKDSNDVDVSDFPFTFEYDSNYINVSNAGGISSKGIVVSTEVVCIYTLNTSIRAKCIVNVVDELPVKEKVWNLLTDYNSLKDGDILVLAAPEYGLTASLDTLHSKLNPVNSSFSSDKKTITSLGEGTIEFYLGIEEDGLTLEAQNNQYLVCTHQGKVKLDASTKTNRFWDIHANYDIEDGAVIENNVESLGYFMYNVSQNYFTTYVDNSISEYMKLPFIYRLEEI